MKPEASFSSFEEASKLEMVYGEITAVTDIPKSPRLIKLSVNFGSEFGTKTILSAIKQEVEDINSLVGLGSFFIVNFAPRPMMGEVSEGMIVPFNTPEHPLLFGGPSFGKIPIGTKLF